MPRAAVAVVISSGLDKQVLHAFRLLVKGQWLPWQRRGESRSRQTPALCCLAVLRSSCSLVPWCMSTSELS
jgi:hypothetical protein